MAPSTTSKRELSPCSWPLVRGRPRSLAQRPLPSITIATCRGTSSGGIGGGVAPDGCGVGLRTGLLTPRRLVRCARSHGPRGVRVRGVAEHNDEIEQQLFTLLRRSQAIHVTTRSGETELDRSTYGILCLVADDGPQRLGAIATR